jgi:anti-sigma factor RsiW
MSCPTRDKIEAYLDNELPAQEDRDISQHLASCHGCAAVAVGNRKLKLSVKRAASSTFVPSAEFQAKIRHSIKPPPRSFWLPSLIFATAALACAFAVVALWPHPQAQDLLAETTDMHVAALASTTPVDVISTDRHTVKPWFEGKLPFTFDLPDLQNSEFHLIGGRMAYLSQSPGAQLLFGIRKHQISVFIAQERQGSSSLGTEPRASQKLNFNLETWSDHGLRYIVVSDTELADVDALAKLIRSAHRTP